jgi:predicted RecA/RadA family phage recombinase
MKNLIQKGHTLSLTAPAAVVSGQGILVGSIFGVCTHDAASGDKMDVAVEGVFELPKAAGALTEGVKMYWDNTAKNITTTSTSNTLIGAAVAAAASGDATGFVRLNGSVS